MKTLSLSLKTVNRIAELNREFREKNKAREGDAVDRYMEYLTDPLTAEMNKSINDLPIDQKRELAALMWCGRGDFNSFEMAQKHAETLNSDGIAVYISEKPLFEYIPEGIKFLEKENIYLSKSN